MLVKGLGILYVSNHLMFIRTKLLIFFPRSFVDQSGNLLWKLGARISNQHVAYWLMEYVENVNTNAITNS